MQEPQLASFWIPLLLATLGVLACSSGKTETVTTVDVSGLRNQAGAAVGGAATTASPLTAEAASDEALDGHGDGGTASAP